MTTIPRHVSMRKMGSRYLFALRTWCCFRFGLGQILLLFLAVGISYKVRAYEATVSIYTFANKQTNHSKKVIVEDKDNPLPVDADWFNWNCVAMKQIDGVKISCELNGEIVETKIFCFFHSNKEVRYLKINKGDNFVSFESQCKLTPAERKRLQKRAAKILKKAEPPKTESIPVPAEVTPELKVTPPAASEGNPPESAPTPAQ